jgi:hypothetical protein
MDKSKKKDKTLSNEMALKLNGKNLFLQSNACKYYLDSNNSSDLFLNPTERQGFQKWEFQTADLPGFYFIKNTITGLYVSSNECGELFCNIFNPNSSYQRWRINLTSEPEWYVIFNVGNDLILGLNKANKLMLKVFDKVLFEKLEIMYAFLLFAKKPEKR